MTSVKDYSNNSLLSQAAYADLQIYDGKESTNNTNINALMIEDFTSSQAEEFLNTYKIIGHYDGSSTGTQVTLFEEIATGKKTVGIAGTSLLDLGDLSADILLGLYDPKFLDYIFEVRDVVDGWKNEGLLSGSYNVTGHSLGGALSLGLAYVQPNSEINQVSTYNSPTLTSTVWLAFFDNLRQNLITINGEQAALLWDGMPSPEKIINMSGTGADIIAGHGIDYGIMQEIFLEDNSHSIVKLSTTLRLMAFMEKVGGGSDIEFYNTILENAYNKNDQDLEKTVEFLYDIFIPNGNTTGFDEQLFELTQAPLTAGCITTSVGINGEAGSIGKLYALFTGCPFIISGVDYSQTALGKADALLKQSIASLTEHTNRLCCLIL